MQNTSLTLPDCVALTLNGRVALITGGSRGIGAATVRLFRQAGARVVFSYRTSAEQAVALAASLGGPGLCHALQQDLSTPEHGRNLVQTATAIFGHIDILIVNHGVWPAHDQPIQTMPDGQWRRTLGTNLDSVFGLVQAATAHMLAQPLSQPTDHPIHDPSASPGSAHDPIAGTRRPIVSPRGHIILVASTAAQRGEAFHADYAASKGALVSLTKSLSSELAPQGILTNCVAPGWVATEMSAAALQDPTASNKALAQIPLGRLAHVDEIAGPILFLCTPFAAFISGEIFNVNGGAVLVG